MHEPFALTTRIYFALIFYKPLGIESAALFVHLPPECNGKAMIDKLESINDRYNEVEKKLSDPELISDMKMVDIFQKSALLYQFHVQLLNILILSNLL